MSTLPKAIYRFNAIPVKILIAFFTELEQIILKFVQNHRSTQIAKAVLKEEQSWKYHNPKFQDTLQSHSNQNSMVLAQKQTHKSGKLKRETWNKPSFIWLIYNKGGRNVTMGKDSLLNKWCWENWISICKKWNRTTLVSYTKIKNKYLNLRAETENPQENSDLTLALPHFLDMSP